MKLKSGITLYPKVNSKWLYKLGPTIKPQEFIVIASGHGSVVLGIPEGGYIVKVDVLAWWKRNPVLICD